MAEESRTTYVVLRRDQIVDEDAAADAWIELGRIDANSKSQARRLFMESDGAKRLSEGEHTIRAVPLSNWGEGDDAVEKFAVKTQRTVTPVRTQTTAAAGGRREPAGAGA